MVPQDDHGRFVCFSCPGQRAPVIPQVPADVELTDEQKEQIPPMHRLHHTPTAEEREALDRILRGMESLAPPS
ncbi:hypothetical protein KKG36_02355 [Patescibacteria group bacterium]|nr:hypothetical protein [Patescibacteria group bacterium]